MAKNSLTAQQKDLVRQFATLNGSASDFVSVGPQTRIGDVINTLLQLDSSDTAIEESKATDVQSNYRKKYEEKMLQEVKKQGFSSIEELLQSKQASAKVVKEEPSGSQKPQKKEPKERKLPSHVKTLDEILKLKLIAEETSEKIGEIWNSYHSTRKALSACLTADFYKQLHAKGKQYPMFVLPLAREEGYEMFLLQFQGHQIYFTPLAEYQLNQENSRPLFELTFYTDLAEDKKIVLMLGEGIEKGPLGLKDAQHLVYQLQIFYVTGNEAQKDQVKKFWSDPSNFNYTQLIESLSTLG